MRDLRLLRILQLFDSQFPVGAFAQSGGLETYAQHGDGIAELRGILGNHVALGWGCGELAAACLAWHAAMGTSGTRELDRIAAHVGAFKVVPAVRDASVRLGTRTLSLIRRLYPDTIAALDPKPPHHAVIVGAAGRLLDLPLQDLLLAYGQSLLTGAVAAATRCMPVSPAQAQTLILEFQPPLAEAVERVVANPEDMFFTCMPALDIRCDQQGRLHTRLFQT
jgi:urease accessory protein